MFQEKQALREELVTCKIKHKTFAQYSVLPKFVFVLHVTTPLHSVIIASS